ncbi:MAG: lipid-binding SYLF domain-containing protein [Planctomycetota bacterium]
MNVRRAVVLLCVVCAGLGCATRPETPESRDLLSSQVQETIALFKVRDPGIQSFFDRSYGYAVLPRITKGAVIVGGAYGKGEVFARGAKIGHCSMSQASVGFSFGGEYFREIIFFREKGHLDLFRRGEFTFSGQATAVALTTGAAAKNDYQDGMAVFIMPDAGLMVDASIAGQKFGFDPMFVMREEPPTVLP